LFVLGEHAQAVPVKMGLDGSEFVYRGLGSERRLKIALAGDHQVENAALAVLVAEVLSQSGYSVSDAAIETGLMHARWPGRFQVLGRRPLVICDGAHNVSGVRALVRNLDLLGLDGAVTVFGVLRDKSYDRMLALLADRSAMLVLTKPAYRRALPVARLAESGRRAGLRFARAARSHDAIDRALAAAGAADPAGARRALGAARAAGPPGAAPSGPPAAGRPMRSVLICGSLYLVGEAMQFFGFKPQNIRLC
jgi:dihydrofolate synthase/folylpolyglutamate synthase